MPNYSRDRTPGATWFFTLALADRSSDVLVRHACLLGRAFRAVRAVAPFHCLAIVVLPEHLHCLWRLPVGDVGYPRRWRQIKGAFTRCLPETEPRSRRRPLRRERSVWQRRYWEHTIRDEADLRRHLDYIHYNPVKHGLVKAVGAWPHSSFHRYVARGLYPFDWGGQPPSSPGRCGE